MVEAFGITPRGLAKITALTGETPEQIAKAQAKLNRAIESGHTDLLFSAQDELKAAQNEHIALMEALSILADLYPEHYAGLAETGTVRPWKHARSYGYAPEGYVTVSDETRQVILLRTVTGGFIPWIY